MCSFELGVEVFVLNGRIEDAEVTSRLDANLLHHLETWTLSATDSSVTQYMSQFDIFQRHMTLSAVKIAGGIELSSNTSSLRTIQQNYISPLFTQRITGAFLDATYGFLDGLVYLTSHDSPIPVESTDSKRPVSSTLLDLRDTVSN